VTLSLQPLLDAPPTQGISKVSLWRLGVVMKNDRRIAEITQQIRKIERQSVANVVKTGALLTEVMDDLLDPGEFQAWVEREFGWSYRTALRYRRAHALAAQAQVTRVTLGRLNITVTALYALAELDDDEAAIRDAIINSGLGGKRLTAASVHDAIGTMRAEHREAEAERQASAEATPDDGGDAGRDDGGADDGGGGDADDGGDGGGEGGGDDDATDDDTAVPPDDGFGKPNLLALLLTQLKSFAFDDAAWPSAIKVVGAESVGKLARAFEMALSRHRASESKSAVKAAADRAEARAEQRRG
jgi:hypothetical protein